MTMKACALEVCAKGAVDITLNHNLNLNSEKHRVRLHEVRLGVPKLPRVETYLQV